MVTYLPKIINTPHGLREKIESMFRDDISMRDKVDGVYYRIGKNEAIFFNRKNNQDIIKYIQFDNNKYKAITL